MHIKLTRSRIVYNLQELSDLGFRRVMFVGNCDIYIAHALGFDGGLLFGAIIGEVNYSTYAQRFQVRKVLILWPRATIKPVVHLAKVANLDICKGRVGMLLGHCSGADSENDHDGRTDFRKDIISGVFHLRTPNFLSVLVNTQDRSSEVAVSGASS